MRSVKQMLLLPISLEDRPIARAWVTLGLVACNVVVFVLTSVMADDQPVLERTGALLGYIQDHPYLALPAALGRRMGATERAAFQQARQSHLAHATPSPQALDAERAVVLRLQDRLDAALRDQPASRFGFTPAHPGILNALSSLFVHAGFWHLFFNMLFLYATAPILEDAIGRSVFLLLYLSAGGAAVAAHWQHDPASEIPLVGASGAIAGVMGALMLRLGRARIRFLLLPTPITLWLPGFVFLPLWLAEQLLAARSAGTGPGVAFSAHVGGFLFGVLFALGLRAGIEEALLRRASGRSSQALRPILERCRRARLEGRGELAQTEIELAIRVAPGDPVVWVETLEIRLAQADLPGIAAAARRLVELRVRASRAAGRAVIEDLLQRAPDGLAPQFWLWAVSFLEKNDGVERALLVLDRLVEEHPGDEPGLRALMRRAELCQRLRRFEAAAQACRQALAHPGCRAPWPARIEKLLVELRTADSA